MTEKLLTAKEAATIARVNYFTMMRYCREGKVTANKASNSPKAPWRIPEKELYAQYGLKRDIEVGQEVEIEV